MLYLNFKKHIIITDFLFWKNPMEEYLERNSGICDHKSLLILLDVSEKIVHWTHFAENKIIDTF